VIERTFKKEMNRLLGRKKISPRKPQIQPTPTPYAIRGCALGKSTKSGQGVAGWRQQYHRPFDNHNLAPAKVTRIEYPDDSKVTV
jgi:hypothetical protein